MDTLVASILWSTWITILIMAVTVVGLRIARVWLEESERAKKLKNK